MMAKIRENVTTNCEKRFIIKNLEDYTRLSGRAFDEFRHLSIDFGRDWGCCYVSLGNTRVLAQVSCEIQKPKSSRLSEGILTINVELNPLGAPHFESGRNSELQVVMNRILEKCIKDSRAIDLESLCIKINEKVWAFRVDINILNHEGNLLDCASIAILAALAHFRRPDVSYDGEEITVHSYAERDPICTVIHHYPVCITYALFNEGTIVLADPTLLEEGVADANLILGINSYKEICTLHLGGNAFMNPDSILKCASKAANRAAFLITEIKRVLREDIERRTRGEVNNFESLKCEQDLQSVDTLTKYLDQWQVQKRKKNSKQMTENGTVESLGKGSAVLLPIEDNGTNTWKKSSDENDSDSYS